MTYLQEIIHRMGVIDSTRISVNMCPELSIIFTVWALFNKPKVCHLPLTSPLFVFPVKLYYPGQMGR